MRTIQIAPYREDCRVEGQKIIGTMDGRTLVYEVPEGEQMPEGAGVIDDFCCAIAMSSYGRQVESLLNNFWGIKGKFYEL